MGLSIGLCYDLKDDYLREGFSPEDVLEFDSEETVAGLEAAMAGLGHSTERIGRGRELARRFVEGERWKLLFNICEGVWGRSREAQVPALCELFDQPYTFADPLTCAITLDKAVAKRIVRDHGLATAPFSVVSSPDEAVSVQLPAPFFLKPVAEGSSKGVTGRSLVRERRDLASACRTLLGQFRQPVLVEAFLPGREVTVGIVGHDSTARVFGVMEVSFTDRAETLAYTTRGASARRCTRCLPRARMPGRRTGGPAVRRDGSSELPRGEPTARDQPRPVGPPDHGASRRDLVPGADRVDY
jgi:D-alanine-D-alanine ligase